MTAARRTKRPRTPAQLANDARLAAAGGARQATPQAAEAATPPAESAVARPEMRAEMRPDMRAQSSAERAAMRAAQIFDTVDLDSEEDKFALPPGMAPQDWEYEWKAYEVIGKRNPGNEVQLARMGWDAVDTARHPEMMPSGYSGPITREGMILMERPKIVNDRQRQAAYAKAVGQVRGQEQHVGIAPGDTLPRVDSAGRPVSKISREWSAPSALKGDGFVPVSHRGAPVPVPE